MKPALLTDDMTALPSDAEFDLVNRYTGGRMTDAEETAFEAKLDDPAFFYRVAPLIKLWYKRVPLPIEVEIGERIAARRAAGLPLYEPTFMERVEDAATRVPVRRVVLAAAAVVAFALVIRQRSATVTPSNNDVHTAQAVVDSPATPPSTKPSAGQPPARTPVTKSPTIVAVMTPPITADTAAGLLPAAPDIAAERALAERLAAWEPTVQPGASTKADPVTVALNIPPVPMAKVDLSISLAQQFKNALAIAPRLIGQALSSIGNAARGRTHKPHF